MKKIVAIFLTAVLLTVAVPWKASADSGWAVTGKILTGIIGLNILGHAIAESARPYPVYYGPPPPVYSPGQVWVPGHYEARVERRWVGGHWEYAERGRDYDDDRYERGESRRYWVPGEYREVEVNVWIPGHWEG